MHKTSNAQDLLTGVYLSSSFFFSNHQQHRSPFGIVFQTKVFLAFLNSFFSAFLNGLLNSFLKFLFLLLVLSTGWGACSKWALLPTITLKQPLICHISRKEKAYIILAASTAVCFHSLIRTHFPASSTLSHRPLKSIILPVCSTKEATKGPFVSLSIKICRYIIKCIQKWKH